MATEGPLGVAWRTLRQKLLDDGRYGVDQLDLETWRLMFMWGARAALTARSDQVTRALVLAEVLTFELSLKGYARNRLTVIDGGNHDEARDERAEASGALPQ